MSADSRPLQKICSFVATSEYFLDKVRDLTLEQGWAVSNPNTHEFLRPVNVWGFPKYPDRTVILPSDADLTASLETFIEVSALHFEESNLWLGTWKRPLTGEIYLDIATSYPELTDALAVTAHISGVSRRKIIAVYNSGLGVTVYL